MPDTQPIAHYWQGTPDAVYTALRSFGWKPVNDINNPIVLLPPILGVGPMRTDMIVGEQVCTVMVIAPVGAPVPAGLFTTTAGVALVGVLAAASTSAAAP